MERQKCTLILIIAFVSLYPLSLVAQYKSKIYKAYISDNMNEWKTIIDRMQQQEKKPDEFLLELVNYQYGYIGWCIRNNDKKQAKTYLKLAEENLEKLEMLSLYPSYINAYKSAFHGYTIGLNKLKAAFVGPKSIDAAKQAMKENPNNPYGYIQYANAQFYMPPIFGGSKAEAVEYYLLAQNIMEKDRSQLKNDWNYLNLLINIVESYIEMKEFDKAEEYLKHILEIEPNFNWVKNELYLNFIKNKNNE